jgi:hypothetical protein
MIAAERGQIEVLQKLLAANADANLARTLTLAAREGHVNVVRVLKEGKANVNQGITDAGWTTLMLAAQHGHENVVRVLLEEGKANVNQARTDDGCTALIAAAQEGHANVVRVLLEEGKAGSTSDCTTRALMLAIRHGRVDCVELMLCTAHGEFFLDARFTTCYASFCTKFVEMIIRPSNCATVRENTKNEIMSVREIMKEALSFRKAQLNMIRAYVPDFTEPALCKMVFQFSCPSFAEVLQIVNPRITNPHLHRRVKRKSPMGSEQHRAQQPRTRYIRSGLWFLEP